MTSLLRRSELAVPAANDHMFARAAASGSSANSPRNGTFIASAVRFPPP